MQQTMKELKEKKRTNEWEKERACAKQIFEYKLKTSFLSLLAKKIN